MWEIKDLEEVIRETIDQFQEIDNLSYIGLIGSLKIERDVDLVILPKSQTRQGELIKTITKFLGVLESNLKKRGIGLISFTHSYLEEEVKWISKRDPEKDVLLHIVSIFGWKDQTFDDSEAKKRLIRSIQKVNKTYYGSIKDIEKIKSFNLNEIYNVVFFSNCLYSRYPKKLENEKINELIRFLSKNVGLKINNKKTNLEKYIEICEELDKSKNIKSSSIKC